MRIKHIRNNEIVESLLQISKPGISQPPAGKTLLEEKHSLLLLFCRRSIFNGIGNDIPFVMIADVKKGLVYNSYCGIFQEYSNQIISEKHYSGNQPICRCPEKLIWRGKSGVNNKAVNHSMEVMI
jgi:hypothetical protein